MKNLSLKEWFNFTKINVVKILNRNNRILVEGNL